MYFLTLCLFSYSLSQLHCCLEFISCFLLNDSNLKSSVSISCLGAKIQAHFLNTSIPNLAITKPSLPYIKDNIMLWDQ